MNEIVKLPTLPDLLNDRDMAQRQTALGVLLNAEPPAAWLKEHPMARGVKYLPIERVEWLLTRIFMQWRVEILNVSILGNSVVTTIRLHYYDPYISGGWQWTDGVGAAPLQTDKGAGAIEFDRLKNDSVMKAAPASKSFAVKDAAENLGRIFGKDLNRKTVLNYESNYDKFKEDAK